MKGAKSKADKKGDARLAVKRKAAEKPSAPVKRGKAGKDPNMPKRPASAFFVFMEGFREEFKAKNPNNKAVSAVSKAGGEKWKSMSDAEKAPFVAKANKRKTEYTKNMDAYNNKQKGGAAVEEEEEESDKSKSEVNDEEDDDEEGSGDDEEDDE